MILYKKNFIYGDDDDKKKKKPYKFSDDDKYGISRSPNEGTWVGTRWNNNITDKWYATPPITKGARNMIRFITSNAKVYPTKNSAVADSVVTQGDTTTYYYGNPNKTAKFYIEPVEGAKKGSAIYGSFYGYK